MLIRVKDGEIRVRLKSPGMNYEESIVLNDIVMSKVKTYVIFHCIYFFGLQIGSLFEYNIAKWP